MKFLAGVAFKNMSGSMGGVTASHNRFGGYLRNKVIPVNPNSARQQAVRATFAEMSYRWTNTLTQGDRDLWNTYAANVAVKDRLGQDIYLTGFNMFMRSNCVANEGSVALIDAGPTVFTLATQDSAFDATNDEATQKVAVAFDDTMDWLDEDDALMQVSVSKPQNIGREFLLPQYRVADYLLGDSGTPLTSPQDVDNPWVVAENQKQLVSGRILRADGRLSEVFLSSEIVTA